ncbi:MAG: hypothetical protein GC185_09115 [Alphaproteobacteria bacterium]|nr:hypothetical protein [Alphaproteobacteria bacterium]
MRLTTPSLFLAFCLCAGMAVLSGCGIKPSAVDPPKGVTTDSFPHTYPDPATDPAPKGETP